jgi:purine-binding chemotaxis protein CheW
MPLEHVVEVMRPLPIVPIAQAPACVLGMCIMRGAPTVVVDVARCVYGESAPFTRFVAVRMAERRVALAVDAVVGSLDIAQDRLAEVPSLVSAASAVDAIATLDSQLLLLLRTAKLLPDFAGTELPPYDRAY